MFRGWGLGAVHCTDILVGCIKKKHSEEKHGLMVRSIKRIHETRRGNNGQRNRDAKGQEWNTKGKHRNAKGQEGNAKW
jgi:hypothetical protein